MNFKAHRSLFAGLAALTLFACAPAVSETKAAPAAAEVAAATFETLEIATASGVRRFRVEIADTEPERSKGLMFRSVMADDEGMLFDFGAPQPVAFWMKNTLIPLDMIFIGADGRIVNIAANTEPYSLTPVPSAVPVTAVLEIGGGLSAELGIKAGDKVAHRIFPGG